MIRYIAGLEPTESDNASLLPVPREQETGDCVLLAVQEK